MAEFYEFDISAYFMVYRFDVMIRLETDTVTPAFKNTYYVS